MVSVANYEVIYWEVLLTALKMPGLRMLLTLTVNLPLSYSNNCLNVDDNLGTYFVYYSISQFGTQNSAIGVATSPTMDYGKSVSMILL